MGRKRRQRLYPLFREITVDGSIRGQQNNESATAIFGIKKFQSFAVSLAATNGATTAYSDGDVLVELGTLDITIPTGHVAASKFFIDKVVVGVTAAAGTAVSGMLELSATSGTNVFAPNISAPIASKHLYLCATTALNADATAGRYTVMVEYTVY